MTRLLTGFFTGVGLGFYLFHTTPVPIVTPVCPTPKLADCSGPVQSLRESCRLATGQLADAKRDAQEESKACVSELKKVQGDLDYWQDRFDDCVRDAD